MSYHVLEALFGTSFLIAWGYIGGMLLGDLRRRTRRERLDGDVDAPPAFR